MPKGVKHSPEFRAQACRQVLEFSRPIREVSGELGISHETLRTWLHRARQEEATVARAEESDAAARIRELEAEFKAVLEGSRDRLLEKSGLAFNP